MILDFIWLCVMVLVVFGGIFFGVLVLLVIVGGLILVVFVVVLVGYFDIGYF